MEKKNRKVLVADDEKGVASSLKRTLSRKGFEVLIAANGVEAKNRILEEDFDVVILDLVMPRMDGWEVLEWMREKAKTDIPVIIVSGKNEVIDVKHGYELKADSYLTKPIDMESLLKTISVVTSSQRKRIVNEQENIGSSKPVQNLSGKLDIKFESLINLLNRKGLVTKKELFEEIERIKNGR